MRPWFRFGRCSQTPPTFIHSRTELPSRCFSLFHGSYTVQLWIVTRTVAPGKGKVARAVRVARDRWSIGGGREEAGTTFPASSKFSKFSKSTKFCRFDSSSSDFCDFFRYRLYFEYFYSIVWNSFPIRETCTIKNDRAININQTPRSTDNKKFPKESRSQYRTIWLNVWEFSLNL